jgi:hypothetical protein
VIHRLRRAPKAPLAIAGILATPLFFVALMAFSLVLEKPSVEVTRRGVEVLADPARATVAAIYLLALGISALVVLIGIIALLLPARVAVFVPSVGAIGVTIALLLPLDTWGAEHSARYPDGVDLIPRKDPSDLILRGEWEENARRTANQIGLWTIAIAIAAIAIAIAIEIRRRSGIAPPPVPPPPEMSHPS